MIADAALASAGSYANQAVASGEVVLLFGASYSPASLAASRPDASGHLPTAVSNTQLWFDNTPAPIVCARASQTAAVVPFEVSSEPADYAGRTSSRGPAPIPSPIASFPLYPGFFTLPAVARAPFLDPSYSWFRRPLLSTVAFPYSPPAALSRPPASTVKW